MCVCACVHCVCTHAPQSCSPSSCGCRQPSLDDCLPVHRLPWPMEGLLPHCRWNSGSRTRASKRPEESVRSGAGSRAEAEGGPWANEAGLTWDSLRGGGRGCRLPPWSIFQTTLRACLGKAQTGLCMQHLWCLEVGREGSQCEKETEESLVGGPSGTATGEGNRGS